MDESARRAIRPRRSRLVAAALAALGPSCTRPASTPAEARTANVPVGPASGGPATTPSSASSDAQPATPAPTTSGPTSTGEPGAAFVDGDGDGVPDARDACPTVHGVDAVDSISAGCPPRPGLTSVPPSSFEFDARFYFASGRSELDASAGAALDEIVRALDDRPEIQLEIVGHTDATEPEQLAAARARRVRDALSSRGVSPARLAITAQGARSPAAENSTAEGRAKNRRVELVRRGPKTPLRSP